MTNKDILLPFIRRRQNHTGATLPGRIQLEPNSHFFILTVAAAESAIGLAILVLLFRNRGTINVEELDTMKG